MGRSFLYSGSAAGASTDSASIPPWRNTETNTGFCVVAACAMPSLRALFVMPSRSAPYTDSSPPAAPSRNRRRSIPAPAGNGMSGVHSQH